jgi:hypothetical protein
MSKRIRNWFILAFVLALALGGAYAIVTRNNARMSGGGRVAAQQFLH